MEIGILKPLATLNLPSDPLLKNQGYDPLLKDLGLGPGFSLEAPYVLYFNQSQGGSFHLTILV